MNTQVARLGSTPRAIATSGGAGAVLYALVSERKSTATSISCASARATSYEKTGVSK